MFTAPAVADDGPTALPDVAAMAAQLATLRGEVEGLSQSLDALKETQRAEQQALGAQRADLEVAIRREELRQAQLAEAMATQRQAVEAQTQGDAALIPPLKAAIDDLKAQVEAGLPYRTADRLAALTELERQMGDGALPPAQATSRLWQFIEDERRLSHENAVDRQIIPLGSEERLVEVARLGMVSIYYRSDEGDVGRAISHGGEWRWEPLTQADEVRQVQGLFEALKKQIRVGEFTVPAALPGGAQ